MPEVQIDISKGTFQNVDAFELSQGVAPVVKNLHINDAGGNVDRPGLSVFVDIGSVVIIGLYYFTIPDVLVAVTQDRQIFKITEAGVITQINDTDLEGTSRITFAEDGTFLTITGGGSPKRWNGITALTEDMPGNPPDTEFIIYNDGFWSLLLIDDQEIRIAGPTAATRAVFSTADFYQAEADPDKALALATILDEVYIFGEQSTEVFKNFGDSSTPYQPTFLIPSGTSARYSVVEADNTLFFLDEDKRIMQLQGRTPVQVSGPFDKVIQGFDTVDDCWATRIDVLGNYWLAFSFPTEERTLVYDYKIQSWSEWDAFEFSLSDRFRMNAHAQVWKGVDYVGDYLNGNIYKLTFDSKVDAANPLRRQRTTGHIDHGTATIKRNNYYDFYFKRGEGTLGLTQNPRAVIRFRDDGGGFSEPKELDLGLVGGVQKPLRLHNCGLYRTRQIDIQMTDPFEFRLLKIMENVDVGTH